MTQAEKIDYKVDLVVNETGDEISIDNLFRLALQVSTDVNVRHEKDFVVYTFSDGSEARYDK